MASNFKQAVKELTGYDESEGMPATDMNIEEMRTDNPSIDVTNVAGADESAMSYDESVEATQITPHMTIIGNIQSSDNVQVLGEIKGGLNTTGDVQIDGMILGDIAAENIEFKRGTIIGNLKSKKYISIFEECVLKGNVSASDIVVAGKVKGDLTVENNTALTESAIIAGNVKTTELAASQGSKISGNITMKAAQDFDFDEFDF